MTYKRTENDLTQFQVIFEEISIEKLTEERTSYFR